MKDNMSSGSPKSVTVVNCFQKLLSSWWRTTIPSTIAWRMLLWIAFKNYYLRDEGQLYNVIAVPLESCELLSKIIIFVMKDNVVSEGEIMLTVVNCFQKLLSSWWRTTSGNTSYSRLLLWIAFKNYYLRDEGQPLLKKLIPARCCELLSKIIIFVMKDNTHAFFICEVTVVNCFQKLLSSWWRTTSWLIIKRI